MANLGLGRFFHEFLVADLVASAILIASAVSRDDRGSALGMFAGFAISSAVFLSATAGRLVLGGAHLGTIAAALGLVPSLIGAIGLGRLLHRDSEG